MHFVREGGMLHGQGGTMSRLSVPVSDRDHIQGRSDALVTLVEYGDFECVHCGRAYHVVKAVQRHIAAPLRFVFRCFPLRDIHPHAELAARAAEAAGAQGQFWAMHDALFEHQHALGMDDLRGYARSIGLDLARWEHHMALPATAHEVEEELKGGLASGVRATPTFFINGAIYEGPADERSLLAVIEDVLRHHQHAPL
jgi:protein-disulfide isomerase